MMSRRPAHSEFPEGNGITWPETPSIHSYGISILEFLAGNFSAPRNDCTSRADRAVDVLHSRHTLDCGLPGLAGVADRQLTSGTTPTLRSPCPSEALDSDSKTAHAATWAHFRLRRSAPGLPGGLRVAGGRPHERCKAAARRVDGRLRWSWRKSRRRRRMHRQPVPEDHRGGLVIVVRAPQVLCRLVPLVQYRIKSSRVGLRSRDVSYATIATS